MYLETHSVDDTVILPSLKSQLDLFQTQTDKQLCYFSAPEIDLDSYDTIIVCMSGGKDSIAAVLHLVECGVDLNKVELWHHDVDGHEGSTLMDWPFMRDYVRQFANAFSLPLYFSWLEGGFEGEMLKQNSYSRPHRIETPAGLITLPRDTRRAKPATRRRFPQLSPSLQTRWCSSALKIDVGRRALNNQVRFLDKRILFITGERREESANRAKYNQLEPHACDRRSGRTARHVDAWRPVLHWDEDAVWQILERHRLLPPVPYRLGWSRSSCMTCIYNSARIWATLNHYFPDRVNPIAGYESEFGVTISRQQLNVLELAATAKPIEIDDLAALEQATRADYTLPLFQPDDNGWTMPPGAFGQEGCGSD